jgi:hypothetical protein
VLSFFLEVQFKQELSAAAAQVPGSLRGQSAQVHRIEIAAGGQKIGPAAGRGTGGAGRYAAPLEPGKESPALRVATGQHARDEHLLQMKKHRHCLRPDRLAGWRRPRLDLGALQGPGAEGQGLLLKTGHAVPHPPGRGEGLLVGIHQRLLLRVGPGIKDQALVASECLGEAREPGLGRAGQAEQQFRQIRGIRQLPEAVQAQPNLGLLQLTEIAVCGIEACLEIGARLQR